MSANKSSLSTAISIGAKPPDVPSGSASSGSNTSSKKAKRSKQDPPVPITAEKSKKENVIKKRPLPDIEQSEDSDSSDKDSQSKNSDEDGEDPFVSLEEDNVDSASRRLEYKNTSKATPQKEEEEEHFSDADCDDPNDPDAVIHFWKLKNPRKTLPTWLELCDDDESRAIRLFKMHAFNRGCSIAQLASQGITPSNLARCIRVDSVDELNNAIDNAVDIAAVNRSHSSEPVIQVTAPIPVLKTVSTESVAAFVERLKQDSRAAARYKVSQLFDTTTARTLTSSFLGYELIQENQTLTWMNEWSTQQLWEALTIAFPKDPSGVSHTPVLEQLRKVCFDFGDVPDPEKAARYANLVNTVIANSGQSDFNIRAACIALRDGLITRLDEHNRPRTVGKINLKLHNSLKEQPPHNTVCEFLAAITKILREGVVVIAKARDWLPDAPDYKRQRTDGWSSRRQQQRATTPQEPHPTGNCYGCGRSYKGTGLRCPRCAAHPDRNMENKPFIGSAPHTLQRNNPDCKYPDTLNLTRRADGSELSAEQAKAMEDAKAYRIQTSGKGSIPPQPQASGTNDQFPRRALRRTRPALPRPPWRTWRAWKTQRR